MGAMTNRLVMGAFLVVLAGGGCGPAIPPASETLPRLRDAIAAPVESEQQNLDNSALLEQIAEAHQLDRMPRAELSNRIGRGDKCSRHPLCAELGFGPEDWYYEVGQMGETYQRARPILIVGFNRFDVVERVHTRRVEP